MYVDVCVWECVRMCLGIMCLGLHITLILLNFASGFGLKEAEVAFFTGAARPAPVGDNRCHAHTPKRTYDSGTLGGKEQGSESSSGSG